jgi:diguanylate cyclase (GGDEF)-like protein
VVSLVVEVLPPWWRSAPALLLAGLLSLGLVATAWRWRMRQMRLRQRELEAQVALRTQDLVASHEAMRQLALTDVLTGAMNRRAIMEAAERELGRVRRGEGPLVLALLDIDHFKRVNDRWGHPAGDSVLCETVARMRAACRPYDLVGRYGGEEFMVLVPGVEAEGAEVPASLRRLHQAVSAVRFDLGLDSGPQTITCSIGATVLRPGEKATLAQLISRADQALYSAKAQGRNRVLLYAADTL